MTTQCKVQDLTPETDHVIRPFLKTGERSTSADQSRWEAPEFVCWSSEEGQKGGEKGQKSEEGQEEESGQAEEEFERALRLAFEADEGAKEPEFDGSEKCCFAGINFGWVEFEGWAGDQFPEKGKNWHEFERDHAVLQGQEE